MKHRGLTTYNEDKIVTISSGFGFLGTYIYIHIYRSLAFKKKTPQPAFFSPFWGPNSFSAYSLSQAEALSEMIYCTLPRHYPLGKLTELFEITLFNR